MADVENGGSRQSKRMSMNPFSQDHEVLKSNFQRKRAATMSEEEADAHDLAILRNALEQCDGGCGDRTGVVAHANADHSRIEYRCKLCGHPRMLDYPGDRVYVHVGDLVFQELHASVTEAAEELLPEPPVLRHLSCCALA
eukprot:TRINITY_DN385_c2_g2_i1.p3 TRINITY_DN385_c2_g2~~TRINITY_DN385_c2_g2_i1.p3  ORF type:complete len:140 (+),score=35.60 TRINITY_DN385_c2_g2_i1:211-630(+)